MGSIFHEDRLPAIPSMGIRDPGRGFSGFGSKGCIVTMASGSGRDPWATVSQYSVSSPVAPIRPLRCAAFSLRNVSQEDGMSVSIDQVDRDARCFRATVFAVSSQLSGSGVRACPAEERPPSSRRPGRPVMVRHRRRLGSGCRVEMLGPPEQSDLADLGRDESRRESGTAIRKGQKSPSRRRRVDP